MKKNNEYEFGPLGSEKPATVKKFEIFEFLLKIPLYFPVSITSFKEGVVM
jgi:hypothetical protein